MHHAVSPAVPNDATERVRRYADTESWKLDVFSANEFDDPRYMANPANRCFFCKTNLYDTMVTRTEATLVSGTNMDDLGDYRPGLEAAKAHDVRHPYVEAEIDKSGVRGIARLLNLSNLAELPAAPCLSSRVETGLSINPDALLAIDAIESSLRGLLNPDTVRCRLRSDGIAIELDAASLDALSSDVREQIQQDANDRFAGIVDVKNVTFETYRMGSAFLVELQ